jgi:hypothetical protein
MLLRDGQRVNMPNDLRAVRPPVWQAVRSLAFYFSKSHPVLSSVHEVLSVSDHRRLGAAGPMAEDARR